MCKEEVQCTKTITPHFFPSGNEPSRWYLVGDAGFLLSLFLF